MKRRRWSLALTAVLLACASAPPAKRPDESRRVPVNRVVPAELAPEEGQRARRTAPDGAEVEWR